MKYCKRHRERIEDFACFPLACHFKNELLRKKHYVLCSFVFYSDNCEAFVDSGCKQSADSVRARNGWKERPATIWKAFAHLAGWVFPHEQIVDPGQLFFVVPKAHSNVSQLNCYDAKARDLITIRRSNTNYVQRALRFVVSVRHFRSR